METIQQIINDELETCKDAIIERIRETDVIVTGKTVESLEVVSNEKSGQLLGAKYIGVLERGRKPGNIPEDFEDILKDWASAKGITFSNDKERDRWAKAVSWSIKLYGTQLFRMKHEIDIFTTPIKNLEDSIAQRLSVLLSAEVTNNVFVWQT